MEERRDPIQDYGGCKRAQRSLHEAPLQIHPHERCVAPYRALFWPGSVTYWIERGIVLDPSKIKIDIPQPDLPPPLDFGPPPGGR